MDGGFFIDGCSPKAGSLPIAGNCQDSISPHSAVILRRSRRISVAVRYFPNGGHSHRNTSRIPAKISHYTDSHKNTACAAGCHFHWPVSLCAKCADSDKQLGTYQGRRTRFALPGHTYVCRRRRYSAPHRSSGCICGTPFCSVRSHGYGRIVAACGNNPTSDLLWLFPVTPSRVVGDSSYVIHWSVLKQFVPKNLRNFCNVCVFASTTCAVTL